MGPPQRARNVQLWGLGAAWRMVLAVEDHANLREDGQDRAHGEDTPSVESGWRVGTGSPAARQAQGIVSEGTGAPSVFEMRPSLNNVVQSLPRRQRVDNVTVPHQQVVGN